MLLNRIKYLFGLFLVLVCLQSNSFEVKQKLVEIRTGKVGIIPIENPENRMIALQISMDKLTKDFEIFPDQLVIRPKQKMNIKIKHIGKGLKSVKKFKIKIDEQVIQYKGKEDNSFKAKKSLVDLTVLPNKS